MELESAQAKFETERMGEIHRVREYSKRFKARKSETAREII